MPTRLGVPPAEAHPQILEAYRYWREIAPGGTLLPDRKRIDPLAIPSLLEDIWLLDVVGAPARFRFRLMGEGLRRLGNPARPGDFLDQFIAPNSEPLTHLRHAVSDREAVWFRGAAALHRTATSFEIERIFLPLATDGMAVDAIMCLTVFYALDGRRI